MFCLKKIATDESFFFFFFFFRCVLSVNGQLLVWVGGLDIFAILL